MRELPRRGARVCANAATTATNLMTDRQVRQIQKLPEGHRVVRVRDGVLIVRRPDGRLVRMRPNGTLAASANVVRVQSYLNLNG